MKRNTIFKLIAIAFPFFLILVVEVILRLVGYGEGYELFHKIISENKTEYYVMNSGVSQKYFKNTGFHSDNQSDLFLKKKTDSTFRVFVQGASTVVGFPFYKNGSFPRLLKHRLSLTFPNRNIEVVNTGITAVNSYTLWDLSEEIIKQDPDLVIIYAGHNEYYGALGAGSSVFIGEHPFLVRTYLRLKNLRFFQLLENGYAKIFRAKKDDGLQVGDSTLMEVMAREQQIPYESEVFEAGIQQFQSNLEKILANYQSHDIPVILSTLVSNERDIPPFISEDLDEEKFRMALDSKDENIGKIAQKNAMAAYLLGQYYLERQPDSAKKYLEIAKELDLLRFRAPEKINEIIQQLSEREDVALVDMKRVFEARSESGIIGDELLTEHVHPNVEGNFVMADAFYNKIKELHLLGNWQHFVSYQEAYRDIPISKIDSIRGKMIVQDLKRSWPYVLDMSGRNPVRQYHFLQNPSFEEQKAIALYSGKEKWEDVMRLAYHTYLKDGDFENALKVAQSLIAEFPEQARVYEMAANICLQMKRPEYAKFYSDKAEKLK